MKKYVVFVAYSLKGNGYTEVPNRLKSTHKLFNTPEEAVAAILHDIEVEYHNDSDYKDFEITPPQIKTFADGHKWVSAGYFSCRYIFGPLVHYDIYVNAINMD